MSVERTLEMNFSTTANGTYQISILDARADVAEGEVNSAMNDIMTRNIFSAQGGSLSAKKSARLITKEIEQFTLV